MIRRFLLAATAVACCTVCAQERAERLVLITADGLRWQELFGGIDASLMQEKTAGMAGSAGLRKALWAETPEQRRALLMPFFWKSLAPKGIVLGNVTKNSSVKVTNGYRVSYPGYSEILTGRAQDEAIRGNDKIQNPSQTVLEFLSHRLKLRKNDAALFGSWDVFPFIGESRPGTIVINAGYMPSDDSPRARELSTLQFQVLSPWDSVRHDYVTLELALDYMRRRKPRLMYIALGETDDWAHDRRYDRTLAAIQFFDGALKRISEFVESESEYRGRTALVITSDHGRGSTLADWHSHGSKVAGAEQIWLAMFGPGIPATGEASGSEPAFQRDIAPTILSLFSLDYQEYQGVTGRPILTIRDRSRY